ncbi:hypothetical protein [Hyalangium sp.]|uniref:hypothetical protein n=1 Tax=Hyalangium sp. TaxID=2028555 RepID=UPI002D4738B5|nr:hypothetical protein [Hyalangium sp.]HYH95561.1 hypothetical protein [Hyalangium sp.]
MRRPDLVPDCGNCAALCCVATSFEASDDFAFDKAAGVGCRYLMRDCRCAIHDELAVRGFPGCVAYDCYGAGPRATRAFTGTHDAEQRNEAFLVLRVVHELLWLLTEAAKLCPSSPDDVGAQLALEIEVLDAIARGPAPALLEVDLRPHRDAARALLRRVGVAIGDRRRAVLALGLAPRAPPPRP